MTVGAGTPRYMPPEVMLPDGDASYDASAWDCYSLGSGLCCTIITSLTVTDHKLCFNQGMIIYGLWYRKEPFDTLSASQILGAVAFQNRYAT